ncbi:phosphatidylcholine-sterol O-acyltransferase-like protein [Pochonia chlamydosporia 170]|uniref:Phosphatidylcholine-sterol O-acyltransferase-like protein n=1 Tax=Pochonia chlamydosporia 170 TaxID=1380566 RepID=A0A179FRC3_METCM|nr:phosphatidylcholine-sterol O-acyltransferase-like protein [Pochonia chlamydosporia 170]OAQ68175.1 phosphatidylcholine-sterol O-acyltransferase-like protein [Pochonia chlamydosporia 170]
MNISNQPGLQPPDLTAGMQSPLSNSPSTEKPLDDMADGFEELDLSDDALIEDQDEAQAALQPAISAAASHLTSIQTPAAEKAAALERVPGAGYFDTAIIEGEEEDDGGDSSGPGPGTFPETQSTRAREDAAAHAHVLGAPRFQSPDQLPMPSPWISKPKDFSINKDSPRSRQTLGMLGSAFGQTRHRSRSAGQEALKKLQKAFPSFTGHGNLLPSLPTSFLSNFTGDHKSGLNHSSKIVNRPRPRSVTLAQPTTNASHVAGYHNETEKQDRHTPLPSAAAGAGLSSMARPRPPVLRRVTSDESLLYHSLSRQSSLGDDNRFSDVREMVNIRFMAIRDSLPEVPNFKMPSFPRLQAASRMSSISINGLFSSSSDDNALNRPKADGTRELPTAQSSPGVAKSAASTPMDRVLEDLTGDLVVLGGYRGSVLRSAEPPHQQLWAPVKLGFNMRKANLEVGLEDEDEETMEERIIPSGMLKHVGPVDVSRKLFKKLRSSPNARNGKLRIWDYGYDWRLSPALSSRKLQQFLAKLPSNQPGTPTESRGALIIAHSLGGLITRHAVNQQPHLFAGVLYAGVPQRCINILGPFRNGDAVLFNEKLLTAQVNFSIRTSFVLLPDDGFCFIDKETKDPYPVDFFNADDWVKWRLSPCVATALPAFNRDKQQGLVSPLSALFPNSLLKTKKAPDSYENHENTDVISNEVLQQGVAPLPSPPQSPSPPSGAAETFTPDQERYLEYLRRTLAATRKFRSELAHSESHEMSNAYPPHAVLYGKAIPTVYAAQVAGREAIPCSDAYDDLIFRPGDGVVLAREAMIPEGYSIVRSGRVSTERGHLTMLGDLPAVARALEALVRGRRKGIGMGK